MDLKHFFSNQVKVHTNGKDIFGKKIDMCPSNNAAPVEQPVVRKESGQNKLTSFVNRSPLTASRGVSVATMMRK